MTRAWKIQLPKLPMPNEVEQLVSPASLARKHEVTDDRVRNVLIIAAASAFLVLIGIVVSGAVMYAFAQNHPVQNMRPLGLILAPNLGPLNRFPKPNLDTDDDHAGRTDLYAAQAAQLNSYGWVDRTNGVAHIPIDRAMDLISQRGLPTETNAAEKESPLQLIQKIPKQP